MVLTKVVQPSIGQAMHDNVDGFSKIRLQSKRLQAATDSLAWV